MFIRTVGAVRRRQPESLNIYLSNLYSIYDLSIFVHDTPGNGHALRASGKLPDGRWIPAPWAVTPPRFSPSRPSAEVSSSLLRIIATCGVPPRVSVSPVSLWCKCTVVACPGSSALIHLEKEGRYLVNVYSVVKVPVGTEVHDRHSGNAACISLGSSLFLGPNNKSLYYCIADFFSIL